MTDLSRFKEVDCWVFDLDNTLYPRSCDLFAQMDRRMTAFIENLLSLPFDEARKVQKEHYRDYGTTLRGLIIERNIDAKEYLDFVHDIDYSPVKPAPRLRAALEQLPGRRLIFTNGDVPHANRTTDKLGITDLFDDVYDIIASDLIPKPHREPYDKFIRLNEINPKKAAMFEDLPRNLSVPHDLGMRTVLVTDVPQPAVTRMEWETHIPDEKHVHYQTEDLAGFLEDVLEAL